MGICGLLALLLGACTPLGAFNAFVPTDPGVRSAQNQPYGPGKRQSLDVFAPPGDVAKAPVVVFLYGGSWQKGRRQDYAWAARALAAQGFLVVLPDYRLYPNVRFPAFVEDSAQAVRWAVDNAAQYGGDPSRIVIAGHSAGAYNAIMLGLDPRYLRAAGVDPGAVRAVAGLAGPYDFLPLQGRRQEIFGLGDLTATQPLNFVRAGSPPVFLATGEADHIVDPRNTQVLAAGLRSAGAQVVSRTYPGIGHNEIMMMLARPFRGRAPVLDDLVGFFRAHTRPIT